MNNDQNCITPSTLVIEYKSISFVIRGVLSIVTIVGLTIMTNALSNIPSIAVLSIWLAIAISWLKKAYLDTALMIADNGIKINDKHNVEWHAVRTFFVKTIVVDDGEIERLIINTDKGDFKFDLNELDVDKERLNRWIQFYTQNQKND